MMAGFEGDPFHEGTEKPQKHLQGTSSEPYTQPVARGSNDTNENQHPATMAPSWETTSLGTTPKGTRGTR